MKNIGTKKLLWIAVGIVGLVIIIIVVLLLYNSIFGKITYHDIENKVLEAAENYYKDNPTLLPTSENQEVSTTDVSLTQAGYLKNMSSLTEKMDGVSCTASVTVNYVNGTHHYSVLLDCGSNYSTKTLSSYISENEPRVYEGEGLYDWNGELVYRGENPNNYVKFSGKNWRIVKITENSVMLILNEKYVRKVWDDRFNVDRNSNDGINDYSVSRIHDALVEAYQSEDLLKEKEKLLLSVHDFYTGKRYEEDAYNDGSIEKSRLQSNEYYGLLPLYDYINASIDGNCNSVLTQSCKNYNYLNHFDYTWWTITADAANTHRVYKISDSGAIDSSKASSSGYLRPVIYLFKNVIYANGNGTEENPYTFK